MTFPQFKNKHLEEALFNPEDFTNYKKYGKIFPKKYIFIYSTKALRYFKREYHPKKIKYSNRTEVLVYKGVGLVFMTGIGSPHAGTLMEEFIALGGKTFLNLGLAGGLKDVGIFLCTGAFRDEGTSHHYFPHGEIMHPDGILTEKLGKSLRKLNLDYSKALTWTIDAPYRETKAEIEYYLKRDVATVEMEASALFAIAKYRKVKIASAFVVSDVLAKKWEPKFHVKSIRKKLNQVIDAGVNCLLGK